MEFKNIVDNKKILDVLDEVGYTEPTEIQRKIIPLIKDGKDVLGQSQTGTGKTLAFAIPILEKIKENKRTQTLILAPTRELAIQISREFYIYSKGMKIKSTCVYGSSSIRDQIREINKGVEIVIGTPGRVKDLINRGVLKLKELDFFVLDEADEMLSMGFQEDLEFIFESTKSEKQVLLFSATMPKTIKNLTKKYMAKDYETVTVAAKQKVAENIEQYYYLINDKQRVESMARVLDLYQANKAIIFTRTKRNADQLLDDMTKRGYRADVIHGDVPQSQRIACLDRFKKGNFNYLIATDVAARGIHVDDIDLVVNYNIPESNEAYVHRIGRTGRANKSGCAISFIKRSERRMLDQIMAHINLDITKKDVPTEQAIMDNNFNNIINKIDSLKEKEITKEEYEKKLSKLTKKELEQVVFNLLEHEIVSSLGANFNVKLDKIDNKKSKRTNLNNRKLNGSVRVFLTIGKKDRISKKELVALLSKRSKINERNLTGVEVLDKFTFVNVKDKEFDKFFKAIHNTKYNKRIIRVEKAKK